MPAVPPPQPPPLPLAPTVGVHACGPVEAAGRGVEVLGMALRPAAATGSNPRGAACVAAWVYACPRLRFGRTVCVGAPPAADLAALVLASTSVLVVDDSPARRRRTADAAARRAWDVVEVVPPSQDTGAAPVDLLVLASGGRRRWARRAWERHLALLGDGGLTFGLPDTPEGRRSVPAGADALSLRLTPLLGEVRSAVPAGDDATAGHLTAMGLEGTVARRPKVARLERRLVRGRPAVARRRLLTGPLAGAPAQVPAYLRRVAADGGADLTDWSWGVAARGEFRSQKVLVLLTPPGHGAPAAVVKVTRAGDHAHRLQTEQAALERVRALPSLAARAPSVWFAGEHAGRWVLGQTLLAGRPYVEGTDWSLRCPALQDTLAALHDLAAATAAAVPSVAVVAALDGLLDRFEQVFRPGADERGTLRDLVRSLDGLRCPLPVVLQHGDPHPGNLILQDGGRTAFVDWEIADPAGMAMGDLLYFFRSYAAAASARDGVRDRVQGAARHLVDGSPLGDRLVQAVRHTASAIGLPTAAVLPLTHLCWVHRALREATRTPPDRLDAAPSLRLLRMMLARPDGGTLRALRTPAG